MGLIIPGLFLDRNSDAGKSTYQVMKKDGGAYEYRMSAVMKRPVFLMVATVVMCLVLLTGLRKRADRTDTNSTITRPGTEELSAVSETDTSLTALDKDSTAELDGRPGFNKKESVLSGGRKISGYVRTITGVAVSDAQVVADTGTSVTTNEAGLYELSPLPIATSSITVSHKDFGTSTVTGIVRSQERIDFVLTVQTAGSLIGRVVHYRTAAPLDGFTVEAEGLEAVRSSSEPGRFDIEKVPAGEEFAIRIEAAGFATTVARIRIPRTATGPLHHAFTMGPGASITGRVINKGSFQPFPGAIVVTETIGSASARGLSTTMTTQMDGTFRIAGVSPGSAKISVSGGPGFADWFEILSSLNHDQEAALGDIHLGKGGRILGKLLRVPGNQPVAGETVHLSSFRSEKPRAVITDATGAFEFAQVADDRYQLTVEKYQLKDAVSIEREETKEITLRVGAGGLRGQLYKSGRAVSARLHFSRQSGGQIVVSSSSDNEGKFTVDSLAPGAWKMQVVQTRSMPVELEFSMPESGGLEKTFLLPAGDVVGKVVDLQDNPVADATIMYLVPDPGTAYSSVPKNIYPVQSKPDGTFRLEDRSPGVITLVARKNGVGSSPITEVTVPETGDSQPVILRINGGPVGTLMSTALNLDNGEPLPEAYCLLSTKGGRMGHGQKRGPDGVITIPDLPVGEYRTIVSANGYTVSEQTVNIEEGKTASITDVISPAGALRWTLQDSNGAGVPDVACAVVPEDPTSIENPRQGRTDESGLLAVWGLLPGRYAISANPPGKAQITKTVTIIPHQLTIETDVVP